MECVFYRPLNCLKNNQKSYITGMPSGGDQDKSAKRNIDSLIPCYAIVKLKEPR